MSPVPELVLTRLFLSACVQQNDWAGTRTGFVCVCAFLIGVFIGHKKFKYVYKTF